jgi:hypothetical protein
MTITELTNRHSNLRSNCFFDEDRVTEVFSNPSGEVVAIAHTLEKTAEEPKMSSEFKKIGSVERPTSGEITYFYEKVK